MRWLLSLSLVLVACGDDRPSGVGGDGTQLPPGTPSGDPCKPVGPSCPCATAGETSECKVYRISGKYISCSTGIMTCGADNKWGVCEGAATEWDGG